jgi:hypothetical protein
MGAAGAQPQHTAAALRQRSALTHHTLHLQEGWYVQGSVPACTCALAGRAASIGVL